MADSEGLVLPQGDPAWSVLIWRADSLLLARLRPHLETLFVLAEAPCGVYLGVGPFTCLNPPEGGPSGVCLSCNLKLLRSAINRLTDPKGQA